MNGTLCCAQHKAPFGTGAEKMLFALDGRIRHRVPYALFSCFRFCVLLLGGRMRMGMDSRRDSDIPRNFA